MRVTAPASTPIPDHQMKRIPILAAALLGAGRVMAQDPSPAELGKLLFMICTQCHGADAKGQDVGGQKMAPPLAGSPIANGKPDVFALVVMKGIQKEDTKWQGVMAPLEASLDDEKMAAVMTYVRSSFGNTSAPVSAADLKSFREKWKDIKAPVTRAKIAELSK